MVIGAACGVQGMDQSPVEVDEGKVWRNKKHGKDMLLFFLRTLQITKPSTRLFLNDSNPDGGQWPASAFSPWRPQ